MYWHIQYIFQTISEDISCFLSSEQAKSYSYLKLSFTKQRGWCHRVVHTLLLPPQIISTIFGRCLSWKMAQCSEPVTEDRAHESEAAWEAAQDRADGDSIIFWLCNIRKNTKDVRQEEKTGYFSTEETSALSIFF